MRRNSRVHVFCKERPFQNPMLETRAQGVDMHVLRAAIGTIERS
jgi:hypothetical protein